ncbi:MAG TPA: ABC transporter permease [Gemmatimonadaceae bacterium]|nr:ABC transporter permease [Gemmatimonadaceae bacterium]
MTKGSRTARTPWGPLATLVAIALGAILVPMLAAQDPLAIGDVLARRLLPPLSRGPEGSVHLLGTDGFGRDVFVRAMLGGRLSLAVGVAGSILAGAAGTLVGAVAAWRGGVTDRLTMGLADVLLSVPRLVLLLVCAALWAPGVTTVIVVLVATGWMGVARLVRAEVQGVRSRAYIDAAVALGSSEWRTLFRHALPNALAPAVVATTLGVGNAVLLESGLSFLGLGVQPPAPSWGNMIAGGREVIVTSPWVSLAPGLLLIVTVVASTLLGDWLQARLGMRDTGYGLRDADQRTSIV